MISVHVWISLFFVPGWKSCGAPNAACVHVCARARIVSQTLANERSFCICYPEKNMELQSIYRRVEGHVYQPYKANSGLVSLF